jgi:uncharacterized protein (DUF2267 family)
MKDREFFARVSDRSGLSWRESVDISLATMRALGDKISGPDSRELAAHLPVRVAEPLLAGDEPIKQYDLAQFAYKVRRHAGLQPGQTASGMTAVLMTLSEAAPEAARRAMAALSREEFPTA